MPLAPLHQGGCTFKILRCCVRLRQEQYPVGGQQLKSFDRCLFAAFAVSRGSLAKVGARVTACGQIRMSKFGKRSGFDELAMPALRLPGCQLIVGLS